MNSSSSSLPFSAALQEKYDVFLSFRGEDTRDAFASHLHAALLRKKIDTYIDNRLERGDEIAPAVLKAIERSKIALVIFSKDYASSTWCLKELVHILGCKKSHGQIVIPVFYRIDPSDVRKLQGTYALEDRPLKRSKDEVANWKAVLKEAVDMSGFHYSSKTGRAEADFVEEVVQDVLTKLNRVDPSDVRKQQGTDALEDRPLKRSKDEVANWRAVLKEAADMSGFHYSSKTGRTEADFVEEVVQDVLTKLNCESSGDLKGLVGIERKIEQIESLLCFDSPGVCCVAIWGMGGIGKTTLADAVFHRQSSKFEAACFLANVRENSEQTNGLHQLRNKLLVDILKDKDVNIDTPSIPLHIQDRLRRTKALIVLDDVNTREQLEDLVGDHDRFCQGSRIIITARDKGLLEQKVDHEKIYNVEGLGSDEALQLFHSHAFGNKSPTTDYIELSREVVDYIKGIPLALKVMGSSFRRCKSKQEWEVQWKNVKQFPNEEIDQVLRISYYGLGKNEKEIFLDIACFHKGYERNDVERMLDSRDFRGEAGINDLIDRSLISISKGRWIKMHDLVQELGRAIAREQRSRLFTVEDVSQVLTNNQRDGHVQAISFNLSEIEKPCLELQHANFEKMYQLRCLRVNYEVFLKKYPLIVSLDLPNSLLYLDWERYPLKSLPSKFSAQNLVELHMPWGEVIEAQLWNEDQSPVNLKRIELTDCEHLTEVPHLSRSMKIEHINLQGCKSLVEIPSYFQHLGKLTYLGLGHCTILKNLPEMPCNLEFLNLSCTAIEELPSSVWSHEKISHLDITGCKHLKSLPSNSCKLKLLGSLSLEGCESLCEIWELPEDAIKPDDCKSLVSRITNIWKLKSQKSLDLRNCYNFQHFSKFSEAMERLQFLNLSCSSVKELPQSIGNLVALRNLDLSHCNNLVSLPTNIWKLKSLKSLDLRNCYKFQHFPEISEAVEHLEFLNLSYTSVKELPPSFGNLVALRNLYLSHCNNLVSLPTNIWMLKSLEMINLGSCSKFKCFLEISEVMEYLEFLNLSCTAVKELSSSIGNLVALRKLDLGHCKNLEVLPDDLFRLTSLQVLNLSSTEIKSLPASIKQAAQLSHLCLINCKSLESLPELPPLLQHLEAGGCTSLKTVSCSSTAIIQGWEEYIFSRELHEKYIFSDCPRLDHIARSNIMGDAQLRIMRMATVLSKVKEDKIEEASYDFDEGSFVAIRCSGSEIPNWFSHKSEGCSIKIELPRDWFSTDFLGFSLSLVTASTYDMNIGCKFNFKTSNGESHEVNHWLYDQFDTNNVFESIDSHEVFVWWCNNVFEEVVEGAQSPTAFYKLVTEVNVHFNVQTFYDQPLLVEKCGICLLYGKDAEMIKQRAL